MGRMERTSSFKLQASRAAERQPREVCGNCRVANWAEGASPRNMLATNRGKNTLLLKSSLFGCDFGAEMRD